MSRQIKIEMICGKIGFTECTGIDDLEFGKDFTTAQFLPLNRFESVFLQSR